MLSYLLLRSNNFFDFRIQYCFQRPKILISHDATEASFRGQESAGYPALNHAGILPATDCIGSHACAGVRTLDPVRRRQAPMETDGHIESVDREALLQALEQAGRSGRTLPL